MLWIERKFSDKIHSIIHHNHYWNIIFRMEAIKKKRNSKFDLDSISKNSCDYIFETLFKNKHNQDNVAMESRSKKIKIINSRYLNNAKGIL